MSTENKTKLYRKIALFQQEIPVIHQGTKSYGYTYADLKSIFQIINPAMAKHKLGFSQSTDYSYEVDANIVKTIVFCIETGESIESSMKVDESIELKGMNAFQVLGSAITYLKRYQISAMLGLITDKDIDASGDAAPKPKTTQSTPVAKSDSGKLSDERFKKALEALKKPETKEATLTMLRTFSLTAEQVKAVKEAKK